MGNSVSALKHELDDFHALRTDALDVPPLDEDGSRPSSRTPLGTVVASTENAYQEIVRLLSALIPRLRC